MKKAFPLLIFTLLIVSAILGSCKKADLSDSTLIDTTATDTGSIDTTNIHNAPKSWLDGTWILEKEIEDEWDANFHADTVYYTAGCETIKDVYDRGTLIETYGCSPVNHFTYDYTITSDTSIILFKPGTKKQLGLKKFSNHTDSTYIENHQLNHLRWHDYYVKQK